MAAKHTQKHITDDGECYKMNLQTVTKEVESLNVPITTYTLRQHRAMSTQQTKPYK